MKTTIYAINYHWRLTYPTTRRWVSQALPSPRPPMPPPARAKRPSVASPHPTRCRPRRPRNALKSRSGRAGLRSPPPRPAGPPARRVPFQFHPEKGGTSWTPQCTHLLELGSDHGSLSAVSPCAPRAEGLEPDAIDLVLVQLTECLIRLFVADRDPAHHTPPLSKGSKGGAAKWRRTATRRRRP